MCKKAVRYLCIEKWCRRLVLQIKYNAFVTHARTHTHTHYTHTYTHTHTHTHAHTHKQVFLNEIKSRALAWQFADVQPPSAVLFRDQKVSSDSEPQDPEVVLRAEQSWTPAQRQSAAECC
jgi:hypothetical protein